jgi:hypothetical protein
MSHGGALSPSAAREEWALKLPIPPTGVASFYSEVRQQSPGHASGDSRRHLRGLRARSGRRPRRDSRSAANRQQRLELCHRLERQPRPDLHSRSQRWRRPGRSASPEVRHSNASCGHRDSRRLGGRAGHRGPRECQYSCLQRPNGAHVRADRLRHAGTRGRGYSVRHSRLQPNPIRPQRLRMVSGRGRKPICGWRGFRHRDNPSRCPLDRASSTGLCVQDIRRTGHNCSRTHRRSLRGPQEVQEEALGQEAQEVPEEGEAAPPLVAVAGGVLSGLPRPTGAAGFGCPSAPIPPRCAPAGRIGRC